ncbi:GyrI-like domain-containing protein [Sporosarcina limicola]|uniref:Transcriptional regulator YdeE n=1 Tax=Sporosarcina limicola TaxID=34101 RepID=A0A927R464_9BACL|nr:GyrI-like domain-containing protein [Sporosarcina limicola]MBE1555841.1 putative transcriptional regulator YdeE [Sporosarcina limicola]
MTNPVMIEKAQFSIMGTSVRTTNANEMTANAKISGLWERFYGQKVAKEIANPVNPNVIYGLYSDYENGMNGEYSITLGLEVSSHNTPSEGLVVKTVPASKYVVFTSEKGPFPDVVINLWQDIWAWSDKADVERTYTGDFEVYDERCADPREAQVDIYIAVNA